MGRLRPSASGSTSTCTTVGVRADQRAVAHRPHVQGAAPADDEVGAADQLGGERRGEPAGDRRATTGCRGTGRWPRRSWPAAHRCARRAPPAPLGSPARGRRGRRRTPAARRRRAPRRGGRRRRVRRRLAARPAASGARSAPAGTSAACTSSGRLSTTVRRSCARRPVRRGGVGDARSRRTSPASTRRRPPRPAPAGRRRSSTAGRSPRRPARAAACGSWPPR